MSRTLHAPEVKQRAVDLYRAHGAAEATRILATEGHKINQGTIRSWASRGDVATERRGTIEDARAVAVASREAKREELRSKLIEKAVDMLGRMDEEHIDFKGKDASQVTYPKAPSGACQQYATAAAILLDKFRLEMGEATGRTAQVIEPARDAEQLLDELEQRRQAKAA